MNYLVLLLLIVSIAGCSINPKSPQKNDKDNKVFSAIEVTELAELAYAEGRMLDAERYYQQLVASNKSLQEAWFKLGNVYLRTGKFKAAVYAYEQCIKTDPTHGKAWNNLSITRIKQAIEVIDVAILRNALDDQQIQKMKVLKSQLNTLKFN